MGWVYILRGVFLTGWSPLGTVDTFLLSVDGDIDVIFLSLLVSTEKCGGEVFLGPRPRGSDILHRSMVFGRVLKLTLPLPSGRGFLTQPPQPAPARSYAMSPSVYALPYQSMAHRSSMDHILLGDCCGQQPQPFGQDICRRIAVPVVVCPTHRTGPLPNREFFCISMPFVAIIFSKSYLPPYARKGHARSLRQHSCQEPMLYPQS